MSMLLSALVADFKASLNDAKDSFRAPADADFVRLLKVAAVDMQAKRPITKPGSVGLFPFQPRYAVTAGDFAALKTHMWADPAITPKPWAPDYPGPAPRVAAQWDGVAWWLEFSTAPTPRQIFVWGDEFRFWYFGQHVLSEAPGGTTVNPADRGLLLLRAQSEAMRELALRNVNKPQQMRDGYTSMPRNGTPSALFSVLMSEFREAR
ncbi:hypothetical protein KW843_07435 [Acidovorax sp. sif1233]|uniref:hypothetical protein n=1 Tax=Acidovorax sp. sif1233 TaxID=2854792 RepID=UPI001C495BD0|nr:hypothetical protein [Acidovorax sp. sif1233]MBV7454298.1 hypothetical protein [Acidovorax sp. sif1233]